MTQTPVTRVLGETQLKNGHAILGINVHREISWSQFEKEFRPVQNHFVENAPWDGSMFETFGEQLEFVRSQPPTNIWTWTDTDDGHFYIASGYHFVDRLGYFITQMPVARSECIVVVDD